MAGVISFTLTGTSTEMVAATQAANAALQPLKISVRDINAAFDAAAARAAGPSAAEFKTAARSINQSISGIAYTAALFAGPTAQSLIYPVMLFSKELKTLSATMKALHITAYEAGGAVAGFIAILGVWTSAYQAAKAKLNEAETDDNVRESFKSQRERMLKIIDDLFGHGKLDKEQTISLKLRLVMAEGLPLGEALNEVRKELAPLIGKRVNLDALSDLQLIGEQTKAKTLTGKDRALKELDLEMVELFDRIGAAAKKANVDEKYYLDLANNYAIHRRKEIENEYAEKPPMETGRRTEATALERIGFVFGSGGAGDHARNTAENTRQMLTLQKETNRLLATQSQSNSFGNL